MGDNELGTEGKADVAGSPAPAHEDEMKQFDLLHHPWRNRVLAVLVERSMSVSQFVDERLIPDLPSDRGQAISKLAYHFRVLRQAGVIEVVEQNPRRGSTELVCRARSTAYLSDEEWARLPRHKRQALSQTMLHGYIARIQSAVHQETFDSRMDRHLAWIAMEVDEQGWSEMVRLLNGVLDTVTAIHRDAKGRLQDSGEQPIRTTWGQLHFESPPLPAQPAQPASD